MNGATQNRGGWKWWAVGLGIGCACLAGGWTASAHDFWLEPEIVPAAKGEDLVLHLRMGEQLKTEEERPLQKDRISRFDFFSDHFKKRDLLEFGAGGKNPGGEDASSRNGGVSGGDGSAALAHRDGTRQVQ